MNKPKLIYASALSATLTAVFVTVITIVAELNPALKDWLKNLSGHHWTSKSWLSIVFYILVLGVIYALARNVDARKVGVSLKLAIWSAVLGTIALLLFYTAHNFGWL
ncbi:MAG: hypothetical protein UX60_C0011G0013 [Berkelbacteria bacterium GW2011_GWA2_46_7]|uniref:Uncharacterized protein n=1 Tax=Berkelbacteria bacterium GW2011_GWA2_46_7 TaxID=1618335 RepID=A0A0G1SPZ6_9BACT|nr:MAG: hypothetical protein UX60_C0011G0013 [Berkelbacteria bacterium GW2011_GWA2_46_7]